MAVCQISEPSEMKIDHIAIWAENLEVLRSFYTEYFNGNSGELYHNPLKGFTSYFITFEDGSRLELMHKDGLDRGKTEILGLAHLSFATGSKSHIIELTDRLRADGFSIIGEARTTGDGYFESVIADPEGNIVEITV